MAVTGTPTSGDDALTGDNANDTIIGEEGNDSISGGGGADVIFGDVRLAANGGLDSNQADNSWSAGTVSGWFNSGSNGTIERWGDGFLGLSTDDGSSFIELDGNTVGIDHVQSNFDLDTGTTYILSFDHAARAGGSVNDDFEVTHNGVVIATISPSTTDHFATTTITITGLTGTDTIGFREFSSQDNGLGPLLDNINIMLTQASVDAGSISYDDSIDGGAGDDLIYGQEGDDTISGGAGNDYIEGGIGNDVIQVSDSGGADVVGDFTIGEDMVDVSNLTDGDGNGTDVNDVTVTSDGQGGSILTFDNGETLTLRDIAVSDLDTDAELRAIGIPCFTPGTYIATPTGEKRVETLKVGDLVITKDHGIQPVRWAGNKFISGARLYAYPDIAPIMIKRGAIGHGFPMRDMMVSPQHRMMIEHPMNEIYYGFGSVLISAKNLVNGTTIFQQPVRNTNYIHLLFDQHEIIYANGAATESFYPGDFILTAMDQEVQDEIFEIFPELQDTKTDTYGPTARPVVKRLQTALI